MGRAKERVLILHGWGGSEDPHWQAWLAGELAKRHYPVFFPKLASMYSPKKNNWVKHVKNYLREFQPDTVICHSLGCTLWFWLCAEEKFPSVKRLLLVCPPRMNCEIEKVSTFFPAPVPKNLRAKEALLVLSTNDHYLDSAEGDALTSDLDVPMIRLEGVGHINRESGFGPWPFALEWVLQEK